MSSLMVWSASRTEWSVPLRPIRPKPSRTVDQTTDPVASTLRAASQHLPGEATSSPRKSMAGAWA